MIEKQIFGRTGHVSSRVILGGAAFSRVSQQETDTAIELALTAGVNHVDVAATYGDAELRVGDWIGRHGRPFFLATKTQERTFATSRDEIQRSLERLRVDYVDLLQLHFLVDPNEWNIAMGPGGALEAVIEARDKGLTRFIGITGHGLTTPAMHLNALDRFDFDSVLLPYSYMMAQNEDYKAGFWKLVQVCRERNIAVQTIKSMVHTPWGEQTPNRATWYKPLEDQEAIDRQMHWILGHAGLFSNAVGDVNILPKVLDAASRFQQSPSDAEMQEQIDKLGMRPLF